MKKYKITVNGKTYDVVVEEVSESGGNAKEELTRVVEKTNVLPQVTSNVEQPIATPSEPKKVVDLENATPIKSAMPGTILALNVQVGDSVKKGDIVLILEAMKMENEIEATVDGVVKAIDVEQGASVSEGDILLQIG